MPDPSPVSDTRDRDGYSPIGSLGVLGDGRGVALVAADGSVDWWAVPRLDAAPTFGALLDPGRGGRMELRPVDPDITVSRRYLPHTNLLETEYITPTGTVRVTDCLNSGNAGALPWSELARRVEGLSGTVRMHLAVCPGTGLGEWEPWAEDQDGSSVLHAGKVTVGLRMSDGVRVITHAASAEADFEVADGQRVVVALVATADDPVYLADAATIDARLDLTAANWRHWSGQVQWDGEGRERIVRSALALKLLMMADSGAIAAAATTSLPERIGGPKNWDYRFAWIRDAAMTVDAFATCGLQEETHAAVSWLLSAIRRNGPDVHVMYDFDSQVPHDSHHAHVPGYRDSLPVMVGNDASGQVQLGIYGDLFGTVADWVLAGHVLNVDAERELADLADRCADTWRHDDAGIWELQQNRPYTSSKMNCWRALDAAARLAEAGHLTGNGSRWRAAAAEIREWVQQNCWSETKRAYTFHAGSDDLDASVLLGARFGFDTGERMSSTIDAIISELGDGPLVYRYSGVHTEEQTFLACAYWTVAALALVGRTDEAQRRLTELDTVASPLGLLSEMCDARTGELVGNTPQALSHLAHIHAAATVRAATVKH